MAATILVLVRGRDTPDDEGGPHRRHRESWTGVRVKTFRNAWGPLRTTRKASAHGVLTEVLSRRAMVWDLWLCVSSPDTAFPATSEISLPQLLGDILEYSV